MRVVGVLSVLAFFSSVLAESEREPSLLPRWFGWGSGGSDSTPNVDSKELGNKLPDTKNFEDTKGGLKDIKGGVKEKDIKGNLKDKDIKGSVKENGHLESVVIKLKDGTTKTTSGKLLTTTTVVASYTTSISGPTTLNENGVKYMVVGPTVLTITDCPCTRTLTFMTSTVTKCVCTTEVTSFDVLPTDDMPFVNFATKSSIAGFGMAFIAFFLVFLTMTLF
ncbi:hypothetical protein PNEG_01911 [Pneumocystis murina B123]|uniref:Uncharacterized protein n=1 Tax=Pneumocystis murina (strain B123) TaxID=1069680 RepID=M7NRI5_PNEMU|nr:hypothetical protein PNEG_01911 [Pneumocystis murina B123]EMR09726.1 hypothetical protein PNEG_01911 [Pneumocystis murina B123]